MDTRALRSFKAVYECNSISEASRSLYISSQGLSKIIAKLERELGMRLFERSNLGVVPTQYARALYPKVQKIQSILESIERDAACGIARSTLDVASIAGAMAFLGVDLVDSFSQKHPDVLLRVQEGFEDEVEGLVESSLAELGLVSGPVDRLIFSGELLFRQPFVFVVSTQDPLSQKDFISYEDLHAKTVALVKGFKSYSFFQDALARNGISDASIITNAEVTLSYSLASDNRAIAFVNDYAAHINPWPNTCIVPPADSELTWDVYLVHQAGRVLGVDSEAFRDFLFAWVDERGLTRPTGTFC